MGWAWIDRRDWLLDWPRLNSSERRAQLDSSLMGGLGAFTREDVFQDWHYWLTRYWILLRVVRTSHSPSFVGRGTHCLLKRGTQNEFFWERRYNWSILKDTSYNWPNNTSRQYNLPIVHLIFSFLTWYFSNVTSFPSSIPIMTQYAFHNSPAYPLSVQYAPAILGGDATTDTTNNSSGVYRFASKELMLYCEWLSHAD